MFVGTFADGKMLAIKRASATGSQGRAEFRNEVSATSIISLPNKTPSPHFNMIQTCPNTEDLAACKCLPDCQ